MVLTSEKENIIPQVEAYHCHQALSTFIKYLLAHLLLYSQAFLYTIEDDTTSEFK